MITSDSHETKTLNYQFQETKELLQKIGFTESWQLYQGQFQPIQWT